MPDANRRIFLLGRRLRQLEQAGCEAADQHPYLAEQVEFYVQCWQSSSMEVQTVHEPQLLGTAGTLLANQSFFGDCTGLLIHADNAMATGLRPFLDAHHNRRSGCLLTMLTFKTDTPSSCGIVETDDLGVVQGFHEKVVNPPGDLANGALYAFEPTLLDYLNCMASPPSDFSTK